MCHQFYRSSALHSDSDHDITAVAFLSLCLSVRPSFWLDWVRLGWVQLKIDDFYSHITGLFIKYFLTVITNKRNHIHVSK